MSAIYLRHAAHIVNSMFIVSFRELIFYLQKNMTADVIKDVCMCH